jgi:pyrroline-5-carboxylate reductase
MNIRFIGGGNMARALVGGLITRGHASATLSVVEIDAESRKLLATRFGIATFAAAEPAAVANADVVVLAIKPQQMRGVARELVPLLKRQLVLTIAAGIRLADLSRWLLGYQRLVRAMPNTPALVGAGMAGLYAMSAVDAEGKAHATAILEAVGQVIWCRRESDLDLITAVSGSGPAYVFYFLEAVDRAANELGIDAQEARRLVYATFTGALRLAEQSSTPPADLRAQVTSKGGTTEKALGVMEHAGVKLAIVAAVKAAAERSRELGDELGRQA